MSRHIKNKGHFIGFLTVKMPFTSYFLNTHPFILPFYYEALIIGDLDGKYAVARFFEVFGDPVVKHEIESSVYIEDICALTEKCLSCVRSVAGVIDELPSAEEVIAACEECLVGIPACAAGAYHIIHTLMEEEGRSFALLVCEHRNIKAVKVGVVIVEKGDVERFVPILGVHEICFAVLVLVYSHIAGVLSVGNFDREKLKLSRGGF